MPKVKCSVENCYYHSAGNECTADTIMVETEQHDKNNFNAEFGQMGQENTDQVNSKDQTICATFKTK